MRAFRIAAAFALAAWLAGSFAQQGGQPPPATPPSQTPPPATRPPPNSRQQPPAEPAPPRDEGERQAQPGDEPADVFVPTEELQPDAAVTFPVDI